LSRVAEIAVVAVLVAPVGGCLDAPIRASTDAEPGQNVAPDLDLEVFEGSVQPILDAAGDGGASCAGSTACHSGGAGGFTLVSEPSAGSSDMMANFNAVSERVDVDDPTNSRIILKGTDNHAFFTFTQAQQDTIVAWIEGEGSTGPAADAGPTPDADPLAPDASL
jgi:hypothetical protein